MVTNMLCGTLPILSTIERCKQLETLNFQRSEYKSPASKFCVSFGVFSVVTRKNAVFCVVTQCDSYKNRRFGGTYHLYLRSVLQLLVTANVIVSSPILVTLMIEAIGSSQTSVLTRAKWPHIPDNDILHCQFCVLGRHGYYIPFNSQLESLFQISAFLYKHHVIVPHRIKENV
jgi:hypothetical protein